MVKETKYGVWYYFKDSKQEIIPNMGKEENYIKTCNFSSQIPYLFILAIL